MRRFNNPVAWFYEPKVGESVLQEMLDRAGVTLLKQHRLREATGVKREGARIAEIATENGRIFRGKVFADCTYEGDLMAQAKVSYTWGRESDKQYGESLAGVRERTPYHQFTVGRLPLRRQSQAPPRDLPHPARPGRLGRPARTGLQLPHHRHRQSA